MTVLELMVELSKYPLSSEVHIARRNEYTTTESLLGVEGWGKLGVFMIRGTDTDTSRGRRRDYHSINRRVT